MVIAIVVAQLVLEQADVGVWGGGVMSLVS